MENKVDFRFSDSDLAAYLLTLGYEPTYIEIVQDKKHGNRLKGFTHFEGDKEEFIKIQQNYRNKTIELNLTEFSIARRKVNKLIKEKINEFKSE